MADEKPIKPTVILKKFFELKEGENLEGFLAELKELSEEEKLEMAQAILNLGK